MFGKVKKWLGIEGVKLQILIPEEIKSTDEKITGKLRFTSMNTQTVTFIQLRMIEKYTRGRGDDKLIDEYELGEINLRQEIEIPADRSVDVDFELPFTTVKSEMDELEGKNLLIGQLVKTAKWIRGVQSEFRLEAEANVKGVALHPFDKVIVEVKGK